MPGIRAIHWKEFEKFLRSVGCEFKREKGDHRVYSKNGLSRPIMLPRQQSLAPFIVSNNLRNLGISRTEYIAWQQKHKKKGKKK